MLKRIYLVAAFVVLGAMISVNAQEEMEITVKMGEQAEVCDSGLRVEFLAMVEDSRCPEGVDCIHAGNATVRVKVTSKLGEPQIFLMNSKRGDEKFEYEGYEFSLVSISPYPKADIEIKPEDYAAKIRAVKKPE